MGSVGEDMASAALDFLADVKAPWRTAFGGLDGLRVDDASRWTGASPLGLSRRHQEVTIDACPLTVSHQWAE